VTLSGRVQLVSAQGKMLEKEAFEVVRWNFLQAEPASNRATYIYQFTYTQLLQQMCTFTNVEAGEQLVTLVPEKDVRGSLAVRVERAATTPHVITVRHVPFFPVFDTFQQDVSAFRLLETGDGQRIVNIRVSTA
jgi:hypothetical protein